MDKEIMELTKKFHDTYEKLAKGYNYETRDDTKKFNINSNNGMLMYATVNEIISPLLKQLKKKQEINKKAIEYIAICLRDSEENEDYPINKNDLDKLLQILEDKEVE